MMAEESQAWFFVGLFQVSSKALIVKITLANSKCFCTVCSQSQLNQSKFSIDFTLPRRKKNIFCRCMQVLFMSFDFGVKFQDSQIIYFHCKWHQSYICFLWEMVQNFYFTTLVVIQSKLPISSSKQKSFLVVPYTNLQKYVRTCLIIVRCCGFQGVFTQ